MLLGQRPKKICCSEGISLITLSNRRMKMWRLQMEIENLKMGDLYIVCDKCKGQKNITETFTRGSGLGSQSHVLWAMRHVQRDRRTSYRFGESSQRLHSKGKQSSSLTCAISFCPNRIQRCPPSLPKPRWHKWCCSTGYMVILPEFHGQDVLLLNIQTRMRGQ